MRLGEGAGGFLDGAERPASSSNPTTPRGSDRHAGVPSPVPDTGQGRVVSGGGPSHFFCDVCDRWHYNRLDDSGGSSFLCDCAGVDTGVHESWCPWNLLDEVLAAGQGLYDAEGGNMRAEAVTAWEQAVGWVEKAKKP